MPDSQTHSRPAYHRGECGIDSPWASTTPLATSITIPPRAFSGRQPAGALVWPSAVTYRGRPLTIPRPLRWQRSVGSSAVTNGGRHRGVKLAVGSSVHRQENRVLTTHSSSPVPQAISWIWMLPVTWQLRGRKQASWRPGGSSLEVTAGTSTYSQTCTDVPMARRSPRSARPIGAWNVRKWVLRWSPSSRTITSLPAW